MAQDLWDGGTSSWNADGTGSAVIICQDRDLPPEQQDEDEDEDGITHDIVALVDASYPDLVALFLAAPKLQEALQGLLDLLVHNHPSWFLKRHYYEVLHVLEQARFDPAQLQEQEGNHSGS